MAWKDLTIAQRSQLMNLMRHNGIVSLSEMKRIYDASAPTPSISNSSIVENTFGTQPIAPVYAGGGEKKKKPLFDKEKVANRVPGDAAMPGGTEGVFSAAKNYFMNDDDYVDRRLKEAMDISRETEDPELLRTLLIHEDAKRMYLGLPQKYGSFEPSPYKPTIGKSENPQQLNALLSDEEFDNMVLPMWATWKTGKDWPLYQTGNRVKNLGNTAQLHDVPHLQNAGLSIGMDNRGQYLSLYDVWDYNSKIKNKNGDNIAKWVGGKPFDIYQRYYLDDWLDIPEEARGNPYIAPAYIESEMALGGHKFKLGGEREDFQARDNTRVNTVVPKQTGYVPALERPLPKDLGKARWDEGPSGVVPIVGGALQGAQAVQYLVDKKPVDFVQTAGLVLMPNLVEKTLFKPFFNTKFKAINTGVKNLKKYRTLLKDENNYLGGLRYAQEKYAKRADILDRNFRATGLHQTPEQIAHPMVHRFYKGKEELAELPEVFTRGPLGVFSPKGGRYSKLEDNIVLNPYNRQLLRDAWKDPEAAIKRLSGVTAHEGTHWAMRKLEVENLIDEPLGAKYFVANPDHPLYDEITWRFADENRDLSSLGARKAVWARSPEEFVAEMTNKEYMLGIPTSTPYSRLGAEETRKMNEFLGKRFGFDPDEAGYIARGLSDFGFAKGGQIHIKKKNRGKFTALKKRTGHSASWFKAHGTPAQKKMAVFALNAKKWKHEHGGIKF